MKSAFRVSVVGMATVLTVLFSLLPAGVVKAASSYDSVVVPAYSFHVVDNAGNSHNIDIEDALENAAEFQKDYCYDVYEKFTQMDYRAFIITQPSRYNPENTAIAFASDEVPNETEWVSDVTNKDATAIWHNVVGINFKYYGGEVQAYDCSDGSSSNSLTRVWYAGRANDGFTYNRPYLTQGFEADYPTGYEGNSIPSGPITGQISGNVQCTSNVTAVYIDALFGVSGNAKLTDDGLGGKNYRFYLSEDSPYALRVMCDGVATAFYGPTVETDLYDNYNWYCASTTPGQNPNINFCAMG